MKKPIAWLCVIPCCLLAISAAHAAGSNASGYSQTVIGRGPHHRALREVVVSTNDLGTVTTTTNTYTELQTGLHYIQNGQWTETSEVIDVIEGGAEVNTGPHHVEFSANINSATGVKLITPDGKILESHILGLSFYDPTTGASVLIAELKDCIGEIRGDNQVVYVDAFTDFKADVRYTYTKSGFEQDIIFQEQIPSPSDFGLSAATRLQVLTEFLNPPIPGKVQNVEDSQVVDEYIDFGAMSIGLGRAFLAGEEADGASVGVSKHWQQLEGRDFLIEEVKFNTIQDQLLTLPEREVAGIQPNGSNVVNQVSLKRLLPPRRTASIKKDGKMRVASASVRETGFVMDYAIVNTASGITFKSDTTYFVTNLVTLTGTNIVEAGTVIKFNTNSSAGLSFSLASGNAVTFKTSPYRPAIFTSRDDNTVGEILPASTGYPTNASATNSWLKFFGTSSSLDLKHVRISYAPTAVWIDNRSTQSNTLSHVQITHTGVGITNRSSKVSLRNALFVDVGTVFEGTTYTNSIEHLTVDQFTKLSGTNSNCWLLLTNSALVGSTNWGAASNVTTCVSNMLSGSGLFQSVGGGAHYWLGATNTGTIGINAQLLAELRSMTIFPPAVVSNDVVADATWSQQVARDTTADFVSIGYHYPPLDYAVSGIVITNATLRITNGAAIGFYGSSGFKLHNGGNLVSEGSPTRLNRLVGYSCVQEMANTNWYSPAFTSISDGIVDAAMPAVALRFTDLALLNSGGAHIVDNGKIADFLMRDCQMLAGSIVATNNTALTQVANWTNNLLERVSISIGGNDLLTLSAYNNSFEGGLLDLRPGSGNSWGFRYSFFNGITVTQSVYSIANTNNAYFTNTVHLVPTNSTDTNLVMTYQTGALGRFYQPTNSGLLNKGTQTAAQVGLYYHTVTTNQNEELNTAVDFGFHYVAVDQNGNPLDSDGDGLADYLEDRNGNGSLDAGETSTNDFYNGTLPTLEIIAGNGQGVAPNNWLAAPLKVSVKQGSNPWVNAPITFNVSTNAANIVTFDGASGSPVTLRSVFDGTNAVVGVSNFISVNVLGGSYEVTATAVSGANSNNVTFTETISNKVFTPILSQTNGNFARSLTIYVTCPTVGAVLHYTLNGTDPTELDPVLSSGTFTNVSSTMIKVAGFKEGFVRSDIQTGIFTRSASISAAYFHGLAVDSQGGVSSWGFNGYGQLGDGSLLSRSNKVSVTSTNTGWTNIAAVVAGSWHSMALKSDGSVWAWGYAANGQIGTNISPSPKNPILISSLSNIIALAAGNSQSYALGSNRSVYAFGGNYYGEMGDGNGGGAVHYTPTLVSNLTGVVSIASGENYGMALKENGTVWTWGYGYAGRLGNGTNLNQDLPVMVTNLASVYSIAAGQTHALAVCSNSLVYAWGDNAQGQLGDGTSLSKFAPVQVIGVSNIVSLAAGESFSLALDSSGQVWAWGQNTYGQLGRGYTSTKETNAMIVPGLENVVAISAGTAFGLALQADGKLMFWGRHEFGQSSRGEFDFRANIGTATVTTNLSAIAAGAYHNLALQGDSVVAWGRNNSGQIGNNSILDQPSPVSVTNGVQAVSAGIGHSLVLKTNGSLLAWGLNANNQLGDGTTTQRNLPNPITNNISSVTMVAISAGGNHNAALDSTNRVWTWGQNNSGQLGTGNTAAQSKPVMVTNLLSASAIAAGASHTLALSNNFVWAWGNNANGRLGDGTVNNQTSPELIASLSNIVGIAAGGSHSLFLDASNRVWACGLNSAGQLGDNTTTQRPTSVCVLSNIIQIAAGNAHSLAIDANSNLWAWGENAYGQLGNATVTDSHLPLQVLSNVVAVTAGQEHTVVRLVDGSVRVFGHTQYGQFGDGNLGYNMTPVRVGGTDDLLWDFNDPPQIVAPFAVTINEDASILFTNVSVTDIDAYTADLQISISVNHGTVAFTNATGLTYVSSNSNAKVVTGSLSDLNAALGSLLYQSDANYNGADSLSIVVNDLGHTGSGGANTTTWTVAITVNAVNDAPTFNSISDTNSLEDAGLQTITLTGIGVGPNESGQTITNIVATSSNPGLMPNPTIDYISGASTATLTYASVTNAYGTNIVSVVVQDDGGTENNGTNVITRTFTIVVAPVNDAPTLGTIDDVTLNEDAPQQTIAITNITVGPTNESQAIVAITAYSDNTNLFANLGVNYTNGTAGTLTFAPATNASGSSTVFVVVRDDGGTANGGLDAQTNTFIVTVSAVNDAPTIDSIADVQLAEDSAPITVNLTGISPGGSTETAQHVTVVATSGDTNLINVYVSYSNGTATGDLVITPLPDANGTTTVSVVVQDDGGNANGGASTKTNTFSVEVLAVNDAPTLETIPNSTVNQNTAILLPLNGIAAGAINETSQTLTITATSSDTNLISNTSVTFTNGYSTGTLTFQASSNAYGVAILAVVVSDNGGGINSTTNTCQVTVNANPIATVTVPTNNAVFQSPTNLTLTATGVDPDGSITNLQIYAGGSLFVSSTSSPCSAVWYNIPIGAHSIYSVVADNRGAISTSAVSTITVTLPQTNSLKIWLKADAGISTNSSGAVTNWADQSGNGNRVTNLVTPPLFVATSINSNPAVRFGPSVYLTATNNPLTSTEARTIFVVAQAGTNSSGGTPITFRRSASLFASQWLYTNGNFYVYTDAQFAANYGTITNVTSTITNPFVGMHVSTGASSKLQAFLNGERKNVSQGGSVNSTTGANGFLVGARDIGIPGENWNGDIAEILVFNTTLSFAETAAVEMYLNGKYRVLNGPSDSVTNLTAIALSSSQISLSWINPTNIHSAIQIQRKADSDDRFFTLAVLDSDATSYVDMGLSQGSHYTYRVAVASMYGYSDYRSAEATTFQSGIGADIPFSQLKLWLRADSGVVAFANGGITNWIDQSVSTNNATLSATAGPAPVLVGNSINGHPVVRFAGGPPLKLPQNCFNALTAAEVIAVLRSTVMIPPSGTHNSPFLFGSGGTLYPNVSGSIVDDAFSTTGRTIGVPSYAVTNFSIYDSVSQSNEWTARRNGQIVYATTNNTFTANADPLIGQAANSTHRFQGDFAEILCFNRQLTASERSAVEMYLVSKYALAAAPSAPTNLVTTAVSAGQISLAWGCALTNFSTTFKIERKTGINGTFTAIATVPNSLSYLDGNLSSGTEYYYRVKASIGGADSGYSNTNSATTLATGSDVPLAALQLWLKADSGGGSGDVIYWADQSGRGNHAALSTTPGAAPVLIGNAINGRPVVRFAGGPPLLLPANCFSTLIAAEVVTVLRSTVSSGSANCPFRFGSSGLMYPDFNGRIADDSFCTTGRMIGVPSYVVTNFSVYDSASQSNEWTARRNGQVVYTTTNNTFTATTDPYVGQGSSSGARFQGDFAEIMCFNRQLTSTERSAVERYLANKYALSGSPVTPTNLTANAVSAGQIGLTWECELTNFTTTFKIERKTGINGTFAEIATVPNGLSYLDGNLSSGTEYYYRVKANLCGVDSDYSNTNGGPTLSAGADLPLANLHLWLKADAGHGIGSVNFWLDQSGKGNHASVKDGQGVPIAGASVIGQNRQPVLSFYRANMLRLPDNSFQTLVEAELVTVLRSSTNIPTTYHNGAMTLGAAQALFFPQNDGSLSDGFGSTTAKALPIMPINWTNFNIYSSVSASNEWSVRLNGLLHHTQTNNAVSFRSPPSELTIGTSADSSLHNFGGDIAEIMVFNRRLTSSERDSVGIYLTRRYALISAPATPSLTASCISTSQIALAWTGILTNSKVNYVVERKISSGSYLQVTSLVNRLSFIDCNLAANTQYTYRVKASNYAGNSDYSNEASAVIQTSGSEMPLNSLKLWLQADAGRLDGFANQWLDQSGQGNDATQTTKAKWPVVSLNSCNGRPTISFYRSNSFNLPDFMSSATAGEAFAVVRARTNATDAKSLWQFGVASDAVAQHSDLYPHTDGVIYDDFGSTVTKSAGVPPQSVTNYHIFNVLGQPDEWTARINGLLQYSTAANAVAFTSNPKLGESLYDNSSAIEHHYFDGDIAEVMVFAKALSVEERQAVGRYLNAKYALMSSPSAPTNLVGQVSSTYRAWLNQISLTWSNTDSIANFKVERSSDNLTWQQVAFVEATTNYSELISASTSFYYRVKAVNYSGESDYSNVVLLQVNQAPSFSLLTNSLVVLENSGYQSVSGLAYNMSRGASYETSQTISFQVTNDYTGLFAIQPYLATNGTLVFQPATNSVGTANITVSLHDDGGVALGGNDTSATQQFTIVVQPVNHQPSFVISTNIIVSTEDAGSLVLTNFATNILAGPSHEESQTLNFVVMSSNTNFFAVQPSLTAAGDLAFQTAINVNGSNVVTVYLRDSGGTNDGGIDVSATQTFTIILAPVNDHPTLGLITNRVVNGNAGIQTVLLTGISPGPTDENGQTITNFAAVSSDSGLITNLAVSFTNGNSTAILTFSPVAATNGIATISVIAQDDGGIANGGIDTVTNIFSVIVNGVNNAPTLTAISNLTVADYDCPLSISLIGISGGANNVGQTISITAESSDVAVIATAGVNYASPATNGSLTLACGGTPGTATISVVVQDDGGTDSGGVDRTTNTFMITVVAVTDPFGDDDYDGVSNLQEYRDGTDPNDSTSSQHVRLGYWKFNTTDWLGDAGQVPLLFTNIQSVPSWSSNALSIGANGPALLKYRDSEPNAALANINCQNGTIRFWFKPNWSTVTTNGGTGPQTKASLIDVGGDTTDRWALIVNTNGSELSFITESNSVIMTNVAVSIEWATNDWHQIVLVYSVTNTTVYIDGSAVVAQGSGVSLYPGAAVRTGGVAIGSDSSGTGQAQGRFEDLETFNYGLIATEVVSAYSQLVSDGNDNDLDGINDILENGLGISSFYSPSGLSPNGLQVFTPLK